ncbi:SCO-spondin-like [Cetorhinus maximus]
METGAVGARGHPAQSLVEEAPNTGFESVTARDPKTVEQDVRGHLTRGENATRSSVEAGVHGLSGALVPDPVGQDLSFAIGAVTLISRNFVLGILRKHEAAVGHVMECSCAIKEDILLLFQNYSVNPSVTPTILTDDGAELQEEILSGTTLHHECSNCTCWNGRLVCSFSACVIDGQFSTWSPWSPCSRSCGGIGHMTRSRDCSNPTPANGGRDCAGPRIDFKFCQTVECEESIPTGEPVISLPEFCGRGILRPWDFAAVEFDGRGILRPWDFAAVGFDGSGILRPWDFAAVGICGSGILRPWDFAAVGFCGRGILRPWDLRPWDFAAVGFCGRGILRQWDFAAVGICGSGILRQWDLTAVGFCGSGNLRQWEFADSDGFSPWTSWTKCSRNCTDTDTQFRSVKNRTRFCWEQQNCTGETFQERPCNLPQCTNETQCSRENCTRDCSWNMWSEWSECSRWCGVGQQHRLRTYNWPQPGGQWCEGILTGNLEIRFCNIKACKVNGRWSSWSPWSICDRSCGGGKSLRMRSCTDPPPKNGGRRCPGERFEVMLCNVQPCGVGGCPVGLEYVDCANKCPRACIDFQSGIVCSDPGVCEAGCRCPDGYLEQDGVCVAPWQCQCTDTLGQTWAPGSMRHIDCNNCTCAEGQITCSNNTCPTSDCSWSQWSTWSSCSISCGTGIRSRFRTPTSGSPDRKCQQEEAQTKPCDQGPCPLLCPHDDQEMQLGESWFVGECKQCLCTPEGIYCQPLDCKVDGGWTPWSPWSDCPVTCDQGLQTRTRACINPPPRNEGSECEGLSIQIQNCSILPCPDGSCESPFEYRACGPACGGHCFDLGHNRECHVTGQDCVSGCYCPKGLLEQNNKCVAPSECVCHHLYQSENRKTPLSMRVRPGDSILIGCETW